MILMMILMKNTRYNKHYNNNNPDNIDSLSITAISVQ